MDEGLCLNEAFDDERLRKSITSIIESFPQTQAVFKDISRYILDLKKRTIKDAQAQDEPLSKRRKVSNEKIRQGTDPVSDPGDGEEKTLLLVPEVSFTIPQRKKYSLAVTSTSISAVSATGKHEFGVAFKDILYMACLKVPERATKQWNLCVFWRCQGSVDTVESIVLSLNEGPPKNISGSMTTSSALNTTTYRTCILQAINEHPLAPQPVETNDEAYYVKAHLGIKEGYLFFMKDAVLWAFKKPLYCFFFHDITSIYYSNITQRTFNLSVTSTVGEGKDIEFAMIDQGEFSKVDEYIKSNDLNDVSRAESRRAKILNINGKSKDDRSKKALQAAEESVALSSHNLEEFEEDDDDEDDDDFEADSSGESDENESDEESSNDSGED